MAAQTWQQQLGITQWPDFRTVKLFGALRARRLYLENYVQAALAGLPTYYFSNSSGNDSNPGTSSSPMQTMAKCNDILSTQAAICYFKAGDEWNEVNGIVIPKGGSLQAYGSGLKPFFNYFSVKIPSTSWTLDATPFSRLFNGDTVSSNVVVTR